MNKLDVEILQALMGHSSPEGPASHRPCAAILIDAGDGPKMRALESFKRAGVVKVEDGGKKYPGCVVAIPVYPRTEATPVQEIVVRKRRRR